MTRKEEILGYCGESNYKPFSVEACTAIKAIEWADQHPREGLWDVEKVEKVLGNLLFNKEKKIYRAYLDYDAFFEDLRKSMED